VAQSTKCPTLVEFFNLTVGDMEPNSTFGGLLLLAVKQQLSVIAITQALIVAGITAAITTYTTTQVLQKELYFIHESLRKYEEASRILSYKIEGIALKQAAAVANAEAIHTNHETRLQTIEAKRR